MENWEFLIQKQGDGEWLPLQSPDVEILEGRYRVVARSNRPHVTVSVRVTYITPEPPLRRVQTRSRQINPNGLMVVFPFAYLKPGDWEIRCSNDLSEMGIPWQRSVHLQVLPKEADVYEDELPLTPVVSTGQEDFPPSDIPSLLTEEEIATQNVEAYLTGLQLSTQQEVTTQNVEAYVTSPPPPTQQETTTQNVEAYLTGLLAEIETKSEPAAQDTPPLPPEPTPPLNEADFEVNLTEPLNQPLWLQGQTAEQILQSLIDSALPPEDNLALEIEPEVAPPVPVLLLTLDRETYFAHSGASLTLSGRVDLLENTEYFNTTEPPTLSNAELRIELREPAQGKLLTQGWQTLASQSLPLTFNSVVEMPADCNSMLILAEISLYGVGSEDGLNHPANEEVRLLASQSFTITADVAELLELVALQTIEVPTPQPSPTPLPLNEEESINLALFNIVKTTTSTTSVRFEVAGKSSLPPLIRPSDRTTTVRLPQLPSLPKPQRQPVVDDVFDSTFTDSRIVVAADPLDLMLPGIPPADSPIANSSVPNVTSGEEVAFQSLGEQQRFWNQVNNYLTTDEDSQTNLTTVEDSQTNLTTDEDSQTNLTTVEDSQTNLTTVEDWATPQSESGLMSVEEYLQLNYAPLPVLQSDPIEDSIPDAPIATPSTAVALLKSESVAIAFDSLAQEVVVEDLVADKPSRFYKRRHPEQPVEVAPVEIAPTEAIPPPTPELEVIKGELIAGQPLMVHLYLPTERPQMAIKFWIADYQTRALLDGPHWVKDLMPNDLGGLEARKQLIVPFGCLEMRLEAIALDLATQEESHKITILRTIIPANVARLQDELLGIM